MFSINLLKLQLSSLRGAQIDKPSFMMAFSFIVNELDWLQLLFFGYQKLIDIAIVLS